MCMGGGSTKPPPPVQPNKFVYGGEQDSVARQAGEYERLGYTNTANYGSELSGAPAAPAPTTPTATGGG